jgi:hypothetical protein
MAIPLQIQKSPAFQLEVISQVCKNFRSALLTEVSVRAHRRELIELGFKQLKILPEKRLKIFILAKVEKGMVWD